MKKVFLAWAVLGLCFFSFRQGSAQGFNLKNIVLDNMAGKIQLRFALDNKDWTGLAELLNQGSTLSLECKAKIKRDKIFWLDQEVFSKEIIYELKYNPLSQEYILHNLSRKRTMHNSDLKALLKGNWSKFAINLGNWKSLDKGKEYVLDLSLRLRRSDIPKWLKKALFFWSWEVLPEKDYQITFEY